jgi:hypothetical protein
MRADLVPIIEGNLAHFRQDVLHFQYVSKLIEA